MGRTSGDDRGFTLIEVVVAVGIIATTLAAGVGLSLASRSFGVAAAATEFDHLVDSARTISHQVQGATIAFVPDAYGDGTEVRVYAGTTNGTPVATTLPPLYTHAVIEEVESLGKPPFAFVLHVNGALGGHPDYRIGANTGSAEIGCPAKGAFHFVIHVNGGSADRFIPCRTTLAATGPATLTIWPAATMAPLPTPCAGSCTPPALPTAPSSSPSCPPNFTAIPGGCTPTPTPTPNAGPRYHVSVAVASATMSIGGTDSFTAQATLTNAGSVPVGTPPSVPVTVQQSTGAICTVSPQGSQPSGTTFTLSGISAGTCTVVMQGDVSAVAGATTDSATLSVSVSSAAAPTPTPASCDLVANGKCYHRIVNPTVQYFSKYVAPKEECSSDGICVYIDSIDSITLSGTFTLQPPVPPGDPAHELLFNIEELVSVEDRCEPYASFANIPITGETDWFESGLVGSPVDAPLGFGEPSVYSTINYVWTDLPPIDGRPSAWPLPTTVLSMYESVATRKVGSPIAFTYSSPSARTASIAYWNADFPGCDVYGSPGVPAQYGIVKVGLLFEIYQAGL